MATLKTSILGIEFENPFLLASAPPTASIESINKESCAGCSLCSHVCPKEAIKMSC